MKKTGDPGRNPEITQEWHELTHLTGESPFVVERVRLVDKGIAIEGSFELPPLARLSAEDQVFVMAFMRCHGSIKEMERTFGISYPTVKNRLNRLAEHFPFVDSAPPPARTDVLTRLETGEITAEEAIRRLAE
jgi:hypothetical protein